MAHIEYCLSKEIPGEFDQRLWTMLLKKTTVIQAALDQGDIAAAAAAGYKAGEGEEGDEEDGKVKEELVVSVFDDDLSAAATGGAAGAGSRGGAAGVTGVASVVDIFDDDAALNAFLDGIEGAC